MKPGKELEQFLAKRDMSMTEVARHLGVPRMTLWRWVVGRVEPSYLAKEAIKAKLGFSWPR